VDYVYLWADGIHVNIHLKEQKITDDLDELLACCGYPAGHWVHLRTASPIGQAAQDHRRMVNAPHLVALDRAGARFERGVLIERPEPAAA
jgi:hypothetical protein